MIVAISIGNHWPYVYAGRMYAVRMYAVRMYAGSMYIMLAVFIKKINRSLKLKVLDTIIVIVLLHTHTHTYMH